MELSKNIDKNVEISQALRMLSLSKRFDTRGTQYSEKTHKQIPYVNLMELLYIKYLENNPEVLYYDYENLSIPYFYDKKMRVYRPDFDIKFKNFKAIYELKRSDIGSGKTRAKALAAIDYAKENGYKEYKIFTQEQLTNLINGDGYHV